MTINKILVNASGAANARGNPLLIGGDCSLGRNTPTGNGDTTLKLVR